MEQNLLHDLVTESIRINGVDIYYIPRSLVAKDELYTEDTLSEYRRAIFVDVYVKSVDGFEGEGQFLQKFNLEIRDAITFSMSQRTFQDEVANVTGFARPREGDLIYFPQAKRMFKISYVEKFPLLVPLGTLPFYDIKCEMFEYSNERIITGVADIDSIYEKYNIQLNMDAITTEADLELADEDGYTLVNETYDIDNNDPTAQNDEFEQSADTFIDFTQINPFSENNP
jgi:hypothetical protein